MNRDQSDYIKKTSAIFAPGEQWLFYWQSPPSKWAELLSQACPGQEVYIPLNWGAHSEDGEHIDFGETIPEADLGKLMAVCQQAQKNVVFLLPLNPAPCLENGGVPHKLARQFTRDQWGMTQAFFHSDSRVHKLTSFFDPRVYQAYRKWIRQLTTHLMEKKIHSPIKGWMTYWPQGRDMTSSLTDTSEAYQQGLVRYVKQQEPSLVVTTQEREECQWSEWEKNLYQKKYLQLIQMLYIQTSQEHLGDFWSGVSHISFLGGAPQDLFSRGANSWPIQEDLFKDLFTMLEWNLIPSSVMLFQHQKSDLIQAFFQNELFSSNYRYKLRLNLSEEETTASVPLVLFEIPVQFEDKQEISLTLEQQGLLTFLRKDFKSCWHYTVENFREELSEVERELETERNAKVKIALGKYIQAPFFQRLLRGFLDGQKILLDKDGLNPVLEKRLQVFISENNLKVEHIHFLSTIEVVKLGEGILFLYSGEKLKDQLPLKKNQFWDSFTKFLDLKHVSLKSHDQLYYTWKTRSALAQELSYSEVRRLHFYNPTTSIQYIQIPLMKDFVFIKMIDPYAAHVRSTPMGLDIDVEPSGRVGIDFGCIEGQNK